MAVAITACELMSSLGDTDQTFRRLLAGRSGVRPLRPDRALVEHVGVTHAYTIDEPTRQRQVTDWLVSTVRAAADAAALGPDLRVAVVVGTGLRELGSAERWSTSGADLALHELHFTSAVRAALPQVVDVVTVANACAAGGYALGIGQDMLEMGEVDAVIAAGCDGLSTSMLSVIGRGGGTLTETVQPFEQSRRGVLLGEGAAAVVLEPLRPHDRPDAVVRGVGINCDAHHETAPDRAGIVACIRDAHRRAGVTPDDIDLIIAHGTGTALNDPTEAEALTEVLGERAGEIPVTSVKSGVGHTSGSAALFGVILAIRALHAGAVPAVAGLVTPIREAVRLRLVRGDAAPVTGRIAQVNSFGFGGVNAVAVLEIPQ